MRAAVERDDPGLMAEFHEQDDVLRALKDLVVAHVAGAVAAAETRHAPRQQRKRVADVRGNGGPLERRVRGELLLRPSGVSAGIRPSYGSTISDVRLSNSRSIMSVAPCVAFGLV